ncbi:MAG: GDSL-type esterase/lipase family protein [Candidatus Woesearchaeota archaeon]
MVRICVFGDSTCSEESDYGYKNWVALLRSNFDTEDSIFNLGISGETTQGLLQRIEVECLAREPEVIIICTGANDSRFVNITPESVATPEDEFKDNVEQIIALCKEFTSKIIWIGNTPAVETKTTPTIWSSTEYFVNSSLKRYNYFIKEICLKEKVIFIDLFEKWLKLDYKSILDEEDGLHPNEEGYRLMYQEVLRVLPKTS